MLVKVAMGDSWARHSTLYVASWFLNTRVSNNVEKCAWEYFGSFSILVLLYQLRGDIANLKRLKWTQPLISARFCCKRQSKNSFHFSSNIFAYSGKKHLHPDVFPLSSKAIKCCSCLISNFVSLQNHRMPGQYYQHGWAIHLITVTVSVSYDLKM